VHYFDQRGLPISEPVDLEDPEVVTNALEALVEHGVVTRAEGGRATVYTIGTDQHLSAAYYRNTIVHFFTTGAIAQVALAAAAAAKTDPLDAFWETVRSLRDLLKFEFFFPERDEFRAEVAAELTASEPDWEQLVATGGAGQVLRGVHPAAASWVLRPILEAYRVLADALVDVDFRRDANPDALVEAALALGNQYRLQRIIRSPEAVSTVLFGNAIHLAGNRDLMDGSQSLDRFQERQAFADELGSVLGLLGDIEAAGG
jgi:glycerol-3-phosphate O-acyltransferase